MLENYVFVKASVWDIFKSFICGHEALKGLGTCLLLAHINKHAKAFFNKTFLTPVKIISTSSSFKCNFVTLTIQDLKCGNSQLLCYIVM